MFNITKKKDDTSKKTENQALIVDQFTPSQPSINIIPERVLIKYTNKKSLNVFIGVILLLVTLFTLLFIYNANEATKRVKDLDAIRSETLSIETEVGLLIPYFTFYQDVDSKRSTLADNMTLDLDYAMLTSRIIEAAEENGIGLDSINIATSISTGVAPNCTSPDPFNPNTGIGCIRFSGKAVGRDSIANFITSLNNKEGFSNAYIPGSNASLTGEISEINTISGNVSFDSSFYTKRFNELTVPLNELTGITVPTTDEEITEEEVQN